MDKNNETEANPAKRRRLSSLPQHYKRIKTKLNLEGKDLYLIRTPVDVSHAMLFIRSCDPVV